MRHYADADATRPKLAVVSAARVDPMFVSEQRAGDDVDAWLLACTSDDDERLTSHRWLVEDAAKRAIYGHMYGDLFRMEGLRVLDVGGGLSALGRVLASRHEYHLVEMGVHDDSRLVESFQKEAGPGLVLHTLDWYELPDLGVFDVVIANDLFPNVDQRLTMFVERAAHFARELRLSLTFFEDWRFYRTRRVDGDELLTMLAWDRWQLVHALETAVSDPLGHLSRALGRRAESAFANRRQVCILRCVGLRPDTDLGARE